MDIKKPLLLIGALVALSEAVATAKDEEPEDFTEVSGGAYESADNHHLVYFIGEAKNENTAEDFVADYDVTSMETELGFDYRGERERVKIDDCRVFNYQFFIYPAYVFACHRDEHVILIVGTEYPVLNDVAEQFHEDEDIKLPREYKEVED